MMHPRERRVFAWILGLILVTGFCTKVVRLAYPPDFYFDEVYHAFTATRYLHGDLNAYDPWAKPPEGVAYEWTHPPLAKLIMTGFMQILGENSFAWRFGSVLTGTASVGLTAWLALELFGSCTIAWLAAFLMTIEGLAFTQSRIAMNDSYFLCFMLATVIFYVRWWKEPQRIGPLLVSATFLGLAAATKWTALYIFLILGIDSGWRLFVLRQKLPMRIWITALAAYIVLPFVLYVASYGQLFWLGGTWDQFTALQAQMWYYHSGLKATHAYQSKPYQWIFNLRPVWLFAKWPAPGMVANIYNLGNGVVLWAGLLTTVYSLIFEKRWSRELAFLLLCYFLLWVPWNFSPRIMLFYHYLPAVPFLCILLARFLESRLNLRIVVLTLAIFWFVLFYPHMTGIPVPQKFADAIYFALPGWR